MAWWDRALAGGVGGAGTGAALGSWFGPQGTLIGVGLGAAAGAIGGGIEGAEAEERDAAVRDKRAQRQKLLDDRYTAAENRANPYAQNDPAFNEALRAQQAAIQRGFDPAQAQLGSTLAARGLMGSGMEAAQRGNLARAQGIQLGEYTAGAMAQRRAQELAWEDQRQRVLDNLATARAGALEADASRGEELAYLDSKRAGEAMQAGTKLLLDPTLSPKLSEAGKLAGDWWSTQGAPGVAGAWGGIQQAAAGAGGGLQSWWDTEMARQARRQTEDAAAWSGIQRGAGDWLAGQQKRIDKDAAAWGRLGSELQEGMGGFTREARYDNAPLPEASLQRARGAQPPYALGRSVERPAGIYMQGPGFKRFPEEYSTVPEKPWRPGPRRGRPGRAEVGSGIGPIGRQPYAEY